MSSDWTTQCDNDFNDGLYTKREFRGKSGLYYSSHKSVDKENYHVEDP
jgi:hypothetical protein